MKSTVRTHLFVILLIVLTSTVCIVLQKKPGNGQPYREKYSKLRSSYVDLARAHAQMLESLLDAPPDLQKVMPEYRHLGATALSETLHRQIEELRTKAETLEKEH
jgi:hypothetical protein